jgi:hypothetical protein
MKRKSKKREKKIPWMRTTTVVHSKPQHSVTKEKEKENVGPIENRAPQHGLKVTLFMGWLKRFVGKTNPTRNNLCLHGLEPTDSTSSTGWIGMRGCRGRGCWPSLTYEYGRLFRLQLERA